jgi:hypothetical protein
MERALERFKKEIRAAKKANPGWLSKSAGNRLLRKALKLTVDYGKLAKIFGLSVRRMEYGIHIHNIQKPRKPPNYLWSWPDKVYAVVREYYEKSQALNNGKESVLLVNEMVVAVNKEKRRAGLDPTNINAIRCIVRDRYQQGKEALVWGWSPGNRNREDRQRLIAEAVLKSKEIKSDVEFDKLLAGVASRLGVIPKTVHEYARELHLRWRYARKKLPASDGNIHEDQKWLQTLR